jgi:hypothetical protein
VAGVAPSIAVVPRLLAHKANPSSAEQRPQRSAGPQHEPTAAELSRDETPGKAVPREFADQEYEVRSAAETMPAEKWGYRPRFGPADVRTFSEQVKLVACRNSAFAAELDGTTPPEACDKGGPSPAKIRSDLLVYLRDSFAALKKSLSAITAKNMYDPIEGPYAGPNTRLGLAEICIWPAADQYSQRIIYL